MEDKPRSITVDLFANRNNTQLERFYSYLPDPLAEQLDALAQPWREENAYAFPLFNLISKCLRKISLEGATLLIICPVWPAQAWYPHLLQLLTDNPVLLPSHNDLLLNPLGDRHPMITNNSLPLAGWGVSGITSLQRAYQSKSCWAKWCSWSRQRQIDPFRPAGSDLVHFLTELFEQGIQYSTINTYRSAISSTVLHLDGSPLGQHKIVCSFMRRPPNRRPPKPRYSGTWEVSLVTNLFEKWPDNSNLDIKRLSRKCTMLLALAF